MLHGPANLLGLLQAERDCASLRAEVNRVAAATAEQEAEAASQRAETRQLQNDIEEAEAVSLEWWCVCLCVRPALKLPQAFDGGSQPCPWTA